MRRMSFQAIQIITLLILGGVPYLFWIWTAQGYAFPLANRSVTLSNATPSAVVSHTFGVTFGGGPSLIGSVVFQYCINSPLITLPCTTPPGMSAGGTVLSSQTGNTGFSVDNADSSSTRIVIKRAAAVMVPVASTYSFSGITNPAGVNQTTYVRISTYITNDGTGGYVDNGSVAFSTVPTFTVGGYIPPFLNLCVGVTVAVDCSSTSGDSIDLGILSPQQTKFATSQYAASCNDVAGYSMYILGTTMTSGNNVIPAVAIPSANQLGASEFGMNLRKNNVPGTGADPVGAGTAAPSLIYNSPNLFSFVPGSQIASSPFSTDYNRMTASYIVNVNGVQSPGVYTTTLTYLATAQF